MHRLEAWRKTAVESTRWLDGHFGADHATPPFPRRRHSRLPDAGPTWNGPPGCSDQSHQTNGQRTLRPLPAEFLHQRLCERERQLAIRPHLAGLEHPHGGHEEHVATVHITHPMRDTIGFVPQRRFALPSASDQRLPELTVLERASSQPEAIGGPDPRSAIGERHHGHARNMY